MSRRPPLRTSVTTLGRKVERLLAEEPLDTVDLKVTLTQLQDKANRLAVVDDEIQKKLEEDLSNEPTVLEARMLEEMDSSEAYRDNISRWITLGNAAIEEADHKRKENGHASTNGDYNPQANGAPGVSASSFRLQEFKMPKFTGEDVLRFPSFFDQFKSLIHENPSLTDVQRFCLLKESLSGSPLALVDGFLVTSDNYLKALELLEDAYNDPNLLLGVFVSRLHGQQPVRDARSAQLTKMIAQFEQSYHEIGNLIHRLQDDSGNNYASERNMTVVEYFLTPHLLSKLPDELQLAWYNRSSEPQTRFNFHGLLSFLKENQKSRQACRLLSGNTASAQNNSPSGSNRPWRQGNLNGRQHSVTAAMVADQKGKCSKCSQHHRLWNCAEFRVMDVQQKWDLVKKHRLCFNCLSPSHGSLGCASKYACFYCSKKHHSLLCKNRPGGNLKATASPFVPGHQDTIQRNSHEAAKPRNTASTSTGLVAIQDEVGNPVPPTAESFMNQAQDAKSLLQIIQLRIRNPLTGKEKTVYGLLDSGASQSWLSQQLAADLGLLIKDKKEFSVQGFGAKTHMMDSYLVEFTLSSMDRSRKDVPCHAFTSKSITGALEQQKVKQIPRHLQGLDLSNTPSFKNQSVYPDLLIGANHYWSFLTGRIIRGNPTAVQTIFGWCLSGPTTATRNSNVTAELFVSAQVERLWDLSALGITERPHEVREMVTPVLKDGRYQVNLPFKSNHRPGSNFEQALNRSRNLERKLEARKQQQYDDYFKTALEEGIIAKLPEANHSSGFYLPFHGVWKNSKLRVVFDGSCKDKQTRTSLNDVLHPGENLVNQLFDVLLRFRQFRYPSVGDLRKAFHQIAIPEEDRLWLKFLWKNETYVFQRLPFGLTSSPFLLQLCLRHCFRALEDRTLGELLEKSSYVDDFPLSHKSVEERESFKKEAAAVLSRINMTLADNEKSDKVLGIKWNKESDDLVLDLRELPSPRKLTKRELLRYLASAFDPLGFATPILLHLKILFQTTWKQGLPWDEPLPSDIVAAWNNWRKECGSLILTIPRWIGLGHKKWSLVLFADASQTAMAIVAYCVTEDNRSTIILSRSRLSPLNSQTLTIPRAELVACLLGVRAINRIVQELEPPARIYLYTDSETCIHWIRSPPPRSEIFLYNRIVEIQETARKHGIEIRHVRSHLNAADLGTRSVFAHVETTHAQWLKGPAFLQQDESEWPATNVVKAEEFCFISTGDRRREPLFKLEDCSTLDKVISATAWLRRFTQYITKKETVVTGPLLPEERKEALLFWIRTEQRRVYQDEVERLEEGIPLLRSSSLIRLRPIWDKTKGCIILSPRTNEPNLILLPIKSRLSDLVILDCHKRTLHQGAFSTLSELRRDYWLPKGMTRVKTVLHDCRTCRRWRTTPFNPPEAPLPSLRSTAAPAFQRTAIDHFGPLTLANGAKTWVLVCSCAVTRALHLELCHDLSAKENHLRLRNFLALRVQPHTVVTIWSDNSTTFRKLSLMKFPHHQLRWKFAIPAAPSTMGLVERIVAMTKRVLRTAFRHAPLAATELATVLTEIAACINLRPLTPLSTDVGDEGALTPSAFLFGVPPPPVLIDPTEAPSVPLRRRYLLRCRLSEKVWRKWVQQYLPLLREWRTRGKKTEALIKLGDLVIVETPTSRGRWPVARVTGLIKGTDGNVRAAHLLLNGRITRRNLRQLAPLEAASGEDERSLTASGTKTLCPASPPPEDIKTRSGRTVRVPARF